MKSNPAMISIVLQITVFFQSVGAFQAPFAKRLFGLPTSLSASQASYVSVCTAELCCCQEESLGGDGILNDLLNRNLPYPVEEAPCLGACGGGAMVSIDFEDGSYALVTGIDETLSELGLEKPVPEITPLPVITQPSVSAVNEENNENNKLTKNFNADSVSSKGENNGGAVSPMVDKRLLESVIIEKTVEVTEMNEIKSVSKTFGDVRDRMRAEAAKDDQPTNPWLNAASYLAKKAGENLFSK